MGHYKSNLRDIEFNLFEVFGADAALGSGPFTQLDVDSARDILKEVERLASNDLAASFTESDRNPPVFDPETSTVTTSEAFKKSYAAYVEGGWDKFPLGEELGGVGAPPSLIWAVSEMILGANPAIYMFAAGPAFAQILHANGTAEQKKFAELAIERNWGATMVLTEPDAGSDVGAGRATAHQQRRRHLAHRGRQALHHQRRVGLPGEHLPPRAGPPGGRSRAPAARVPRACRCSSSRSSSSTTTARSASATAPTSPTSRRRWA